MCSFHDLHCKCGVWLAAEEIDCANYLNNLPRGNLDEEPERITVFDQLCVICQFERFRWPEVDVWADVEAGYVDLEDLLRQWVDAGLGW
jgi:hypothetical protein